MNANINLEGRHWDMGQSKGAINVTVTPDRLLVVLHGSAGCGKSTLLHDLHVEPYVVCADTLRLAYMPPIPDSENPGGFRITNEFDGEVWRLLERIVRIRMGHGVPLIIVDAQHARIRDISRYEGMAAENGYHLVVCDLSDVPEDEVIRRNAARPGWKCVPESVIRRFYAVNDRCHAEMLSRFDCVDATAFGHIVSAMLSDGAIRQFAE